VEDPLEVPWVPHRPQAGSCRPLPPEMPPVEKPATPTAPAAPATLDTTALAKRALWPRPRWVHRTNGRRSRPCVTRRWPIADGHDPRKAGRCGAAGWAAAGRTSVHCGHGGGGSGAEFGLRGSKSPTSVRPARRRRSPGRPNRAAHGAGPKRGRSRGGERGDAPGAQATAPHAPEPRGEGAEEVGEGWDPGSGALDCGVPARQGWTDQIRRVRLFLGSWGSRGAQLRFRALRSRGCSL
jgi:hypothetical protein